MWKFFSVFASTMMVVAISLIGILRASGQPALGSMRISTPPLPEGEVKQILDLPEGDSPEGVTLDSLGNVFVGNRRPAQNGIIAEILKIKPDGSISVLTTFEPNLNPNDESLLGLATDRTERVYAAFQSSDTLLNGVWRVERDGSKTLLSGSQAITFPNALTFDPHGNLYVTDSFSGSVWRFDIDGNVAQWVQHELLEPAEDDPFGFPVPGANGIVFYPPNRLYVANTEKGLLVRIQIQPDGSPGQVDLVAGGLDLLTIDGIAVGVQGDIYGVIPGYTILGTYPLVKINTDTGEVVPIVTNEEEMAKFDVPLSLAFGRGARDRESVFITNGDLPVVPGGPGPGVVQAGVGAPGFPGR
jgi:hypothetical protein